MQNVIETIKAARRVSTPLIAIQTSDQIATRRSVATAIGRDQDARVSWDAIQGLVGMNAPGKAWVATVVSKDPTEVAARTSRPEDVLALLPQLPADEKAGGIAFLMNAQAFVSDPVFATGVLNLREIYKANMRTLVMLGPSFHLPPELQQDVMVVDEPMPGDEDLAEKAKRTFQYGKLPAPDAKTLARVVDAVRGLSAFSAEQVIAQSLHAGGIDLDVCWQRKRAAVLQTRGLKMPEGGPTFEDMGGNSQAVEFAHELFEGYDPPTCVVWIDELEKAMAGFGSDGGPGDSSGVTQDQVGQILTEMEESAEQRNGPGGLIAVGPAGSGKSMYAKAMARTFGVPLIQLDLGGMKDSLVGSSEGLIRNALKVIDSVSGGRAFFVATCNRLKAIPTELKRRFTSGIWFFDLPSRQERQDIWSINLRRFERLRDRVAAKDATIIGEDGRVLLPDDTYWTGAEIRNVCQLSNRLCKKEGDKRRPISLVEASTYIVPVFKSDPKGINDLRELADGSFLSASYPGTYNKNRNPEQLEDGRRFEGFGESGEQPLMAAVIIGPAPKGAAEAVAEATGKKKKQMN